MVTDRVLRDLIPLGFLIFLVWEVVWVASPVRFRGVGSGNKRPVTQGT